MAERLHTYAEFWPYYLAEHSRPACRALHYIGTSLGIACLLAATVIHNPWLLPAGFVSGYAFAWVGHFFIEHNRPATFTYPGWSFISDFRMLGLFVTGKLGPHLAAAGVGKGAPAPA